MNKYLFDAVELTPASGKSIGIYRYAVGLAFSIAAQLREGESLLVVCNGSNIADFKALSSFRGVQLVTLRPEMPGHVWRQWWARLGCALFVRKVGATLYFSPKGFIPRTWSWPAQVKRVCTIHDLIPFWYFERWPSYFGRVETRLVGDAFKHAMAEADQIVAISSDTSLALQAAGVMPDRVSRVLNGVDEAKPCPPRDCLPQGLPNNFVFAMASQLPHKNLAGVLSAYATYRQLAGAHALPLALCGTTEITQEGVMALGRVSQEALDALYGHASAFLFLSLIEGFGYPPIEALRMGTPVIASDLQVFHEVCGDLARYANPIDAHAVALQLQEALATPLTPEARASLAAQARQRIRDQLSWTQCGAGVLRSWRSQVARPAQGGVA